MVPGGGVELEPFAGVRARRRNPERAARVEGPLRSRIHQEKLVPGGGVEPPRAEARRILSHPPNLLKLYDNRMFAGLP